MIAIEKLTGIDFFNKPGIQVKLLINNTLYNTRELLKNPLYAELIVRVNAKSTEYRGMDNIKMSDEITIISLSNLEYISKLYRKITNVTKSTMTFIVNGVNNDDIAIIRHVNILLDSCKSLNIALLAMNKAILIKNINIMNINTFIDAIVDLHNGLRLVHILKTVNTCTNDSDSNVYLLYTRLCGIHEDTKKFISSFKKHSRRNIKNKAILNKVLNNTVIRALHIQNNALEFNKEIIMNINAYDKGSYSKYIETYDELSGYVNAAMLSHICSGKGIWSIEPESPSRIVKCMSDIVVLSSVIAGINIVIANRYIKN